MRRSTDEVLTITATEPDRGTVKRHYYRWRAQQGLQERCDNEACVFHTQPLLWNGAPFKPIVDHRSGNPADNRHENLRLLCPNCDAQNKLTRGGANVGRINRFSDGSYMADNRDGTANAVLKAASLGPTAKFGTPVALQTSPERDEDAA